MANGTFGQKLALGFGFSGLVLILVAGAGYRSTKQLIAVDKAVKHSQEVRRLLSDILSGYQDAETGQRGYLLTGQDAYLEPYTTGLSDIARLDRQLSQLTTDSPAQQQSLTELRKVGGERLAILQRVIESRKQNGLAAAQSEVLRGTGLIAMNHVRALIRQMDSTESDLLEARRKAAEENAARATSSILYGSIAGLAVLGVASWWMIRTMSNQIGSAVQHVRTSSVELQSVATQQASTARQQATSMTEISTTLNELLTTSRQIAENAQEVSSTAEQVTEAAQQGSVNVDKNRDSIQAIHGQVKRIVEHMLELDRKSGQAGLVTEIVAELAEQTNILATNATIEAVGTGESGRRFGAVADEIRKLADRVGGSTKEIRNLIEEIRSAVQATVAATESGAKSANHGVRQFDELTHSFQKITRIVSASVDSSRGIELSTRQQATAVEQVNIAVANLTQGARQTESSTTQTLQTANQLASLSLELQQIVSASA